MSHTCAPSSLSHHTPTPRCEMFINIRYAISPLWLSLSPALSPLSLSAASCRGQTTAQAQLTADSWRLESSYSRLRGSDRCRRHSRRLQVLAREKTQGRHPGRIIRYYTRRREVQSERRSCYSYKTLRPRPRGWLFLLECELKTDGPSEGMGKPQAMKTKKEPLKG